MARALTFSYNGSEFALEVNRIDRSKIYGSVEIKTLDADGGQCTLVTLASDGSTLIGYGGTAFAYMNPDGQWLDRADLTPVSIDGKPLGSVESSFKLTTELREQCSIEDYLDHNIRLTYALAAADPMPDDLKKLLRDGAIFCFPFSYRGGVDPDQAFLLMDEQNNPWLMVAEQSAVRDVGLEQAGLVGDEDDEDESESDDGSALDFGVL